MSVRFILALFALAVLALGVYGFPVLQAYYRNFAFSATVPIEKINWSVHKIDDEDWRPKALFQYQIEGKNYEKEEIFQGEKFRNPYAAQEALKELSLTFNKVWYAPRNPANATLEKYFPTKRAIYSFILFMIFFYSAWGIKQYTSYWFKQHPPRFK